MKNIGAAAPLTIIDAAKPHHAAPVSTPMKLSFSHFCHDETQFCRLNLILYTKLGNILTKDNFVRQKSFCHNHDKIHFVTT